MVRNFGLHQNNRYFEQGFSRTVETIRNVVSFSVRIRNKRKENPYKAVQITLKLHELLWVERRSLMILFFFCLRISHPRSGNYCVCDGGGTHTPCRTHIFLTHFPCVAYRHRVHAWPKVFAVRMSHLAISPSPFSCFILAVPARSLRHLVPVCTFLAELFPIRKRGSSALPHERRGVWPPGRSDALHKLRSQRVWQVYFCRWRHDAYQRSELRQHLSLFKNHTREHWTVRCFHNARSLCFARFSWWKQRQHASGNRCWTEREKKEKVLWQVLQSRCQRKVDGTLLGVILFRLTENSVLMNEISEKTWNEELNKLFLVKFSSEKIIFDWVRPGDSELWAKEIQNIFFLIESRRELESQRRQLMEANQWADQTQREGIHFV